MSEPVKCDHCGNTGRRRMKRICPVGWFYAEVTIDGETCYIYACSDTCRTVKWKEGPGDLWK